MADENETRVTSHTGGQKGAKEARFDLIPAEAVWWLAILYGRGAKKYTQYGDCDCNALAENSSEHAPECSALIVVSRGDHNWRKGYDWSLSFAAAMRHLWAFWRGEDMDPETGVPHPICAAFHMFGLTTFMEIHPEFDDRPGKP